MSGRLVSVRSVAVAVFTALVVAATVVTIVLGVMYGGARAEENARESALTAAREYVQKMYAWTPENVSDNINFMMGVLTGKAKEEYERYILGERIAEEIKQQKVVATVTDQGSGVVENTRDTAKVLLFINQSASRAGTEDVQVNPSRVVYTMEFRGGKWLINDAQILTDQTLEDLVAERDGTPRPETSMPVSPPPSSPAAESSEPTPTPEPVPTG
ncbi:hypothetical protein C6V83_04080 [Gordonia iterans]|uniref:Mammalian cell entry protein n=1 Tax=Gordonia iterans TaxID=1004901 RepID=A0A2S0KD62_9ACTN|nr:hypothetical protein [Gordonia iterans]AVL99580.1 hypothetical protein C6V83_04080 [Gordonia iterans]